jgi:hypothetical protein
VIDLRFESGRYARPLRFLQFDHARCCSPSEPCVQIAARHSVPSALAITPNEGVFRCHEGVSRNAERWGLTRGTREHRPMRTAFTRTNRMRAHAKELAKEAPLGPVKVHNQEARFRPNTRTGRDLRRAGAEGVHRSSLDWLVTTIHTLDNARHRSDLRLRDYRRSEVCWTYE